LLPTIIATYLNKSDALNMAQYDFSRLSVLVVENTKFMQSLILNILRALGVERVTLCENGEEAIQVLTPIDETSKPLIGMTGIDLIFCDMYMPVVDGTMFLRWLRRSEKSPDRYLPFIMISATTEMDKLFDARDAGVDEFLAKPFSATMIVSRIKSIIESPRPYVYCPTYFGPNRRRKHQTVKNERRVISDEETVILHSGRDIPLANNSDKRVWMLGQQNRLKSKVTTGAADGASPGFDAALIAAIEEKITDMEDDYTDWVGESIDELNKTYSNMVENPSASEQFMPTINRVAQQLHDQGSLFGYPLLTQFGKSLAESTLPGTEPGPQLLDLIKAHNDLIEVVMTQRVKGDGGKTGKDLVSNLSKAMETFSGSE